VAGRVTRDPRPGMLGAPRYGHPQPELHQKEIDIWYVTEGGSLVMGRKFVDAKATGSGEAQGTGIRPEPTP
jgi:hypothetical protein